MTTGFSHYFLASSLSLLISAAALVIGGVALILRGLHIRSELVAARIALITPLSAGGDGDVSAKTVAPGMSLPHTYNEFDREVVRLFNQIGVRPANALTAFFAIRIAAGACLGMLVPVFGGHIAIFAASVALRISLGVGGALAGWFLPLIVIQQLRARHIAAVLAGFPDGLELLVICAEAGLALEEGISRVVAELEFSQPALAEEFALTAADLKILSSRDDALANLAKRVDEQSVRSAVTTLTQTMRYGTPLAQALRTVASEMRNESLFRLEERANRLPALLTVPMILFIMPTIFLIVGGPAALRLIDVL